MGPLAAGPDGLGVVLDVSSGRVHVEELSSVGRIETGKEKSDAEGSGQGSAVGVGFAELDGQVGDGLQQKMQVIQRNQFSKC